ncbi:Na+/melibiose symporter [Nonomuraea jiangxiensis]|uniref:Na+/melibiose symporter n=2 Tax=Nonomuraea jiangxiensis TaxID=633440 RepID=A0A1G8CJ73_9ACTN|nr:Na+/melibiose symporter [Nonomuraea jiangxiensis]
MALLRGNRDFRRLLLASLVSQTGDWVVSTGLAFHVYQLTGSTLSSAIMLLVTRLPDVLFGSLAGVLADRWDRRRLLVATDLLLAAGLLPLLVVRGPDQVWIVYAVALWSGVLGTLLAPAQKALLPGLVAGSRLVPANALHAQSGQVARLLGAALGGVAVTAGGLPAIVLLDVTSFLISAALQATLRAPARSAAVTSVGGQWVSGLRLAGTDPGVRSLVVYMVITGLGEGIFATLAAPFVADVLGGGADAYGVFVSAQAVGGLVGGLVVAVALGRAGPRALLGWGTVVFGVLDLALFAYPLVAPALWPALVLIALAGVPAAAATAGFATLAQTVTADDRRGGVIGLLGSAQAATSLGGMALAGVLGGPVGIVAMLCLHGGGLVVAGLLVLALGRSRSRTFPTVSGEADVG